MTIHVVPVNDLAEHDTEGRECPCGVRYLEEANGVVAVHQSFDGREKREKVMARELTDHIVSKDPSHQLAIEVMDEPGPGGANHVYIITDPPRFDQNPPRAVELDFQKGPINEVGVNGITNEALIAIVIDRMRGFQNGPYKCRENAIALTHFEEGLMWLQRRTLERLKRGVEGTMKV